MPDVKEMFEIITRTTLPGPGALERQHGRQHRHTVKRRAGGYAVAAAILAIAVGAALILDRQEGSEGSAVAQPPLEPGWYLVNVHDGSATRFPLEQKDGWWYQYSPDGTQVIFVRNDADGHEQIFLMNADGTNEQQLTTNPYEAKEPAWSWDGDRIAYTTFAPDNSREIYVMDLESRTSTRLTNEPRDAYTARWSPDGSHIAFGTKIVAENPPAAGDFRSVTEVIDLETGEVLRLLGDRSFAAWAASWSPNGGQMAFVSDFGTDARVALADADGSDPREITTSQSEVPQWSPDGRMIAYNVWTSEDEVAVWLYDTETEQHRLLRSGVRAEFWEDDGTLLVSTYEKPLPGHTLDH